MGTVFSIDIRDPGIWEDAIAAVVTCLHRVDAVFSTYQDDSDISRIRRRELALGDADPDVSRVLELCAQVERESDGYFTAFEGSDLDPTGLVKGWAIERASDLLRAHGSHHHAVNGGGDIQLVGDADLAPPWRIGISHPLERDRLLTVVTGDSFAIATPGVAERGMHIVNPHNGGPAHGLVSVTVVGPSLTGVDAYATAAFAMGPGALELGRGPARPRGPGRLPRRHPHAHERVPDGAVVVEGRGVDQDGVVTEARPRAASTTASAKATRRRRGEPRRLLLDAARDLFARQDYRSTTTREIAEAAGVAEHLLFRQFGSKAALFHEALVVPFTQFVDDFNTVWQDVVPEETDEQELASRFVGQLYDLFVAHRGLVVTLWTADALSDEELAETGIPEVTDALALLGRISTEGRDLRGIPAGHPDLAAHSTVAMIAGMAAFRSTFFGSDPPPRDAIVHELTQAILHGFLHRDPGGPV